MVINRGDIYWIRLDIPEGTEPDYSHPYVVVQDDLFNHSRIPSLVVCALSTNLNLAALPGNVLLDSGEGGLEKQSVVVVSKISTVDKTSLGTLIGSLNESRMRQILAGIRFLQSFTEHPHTGPSK